MKTIERKEWKITFDPETNDYKTERVTWERALTKEEQKIYNFYYIAVRLCIIMSIIFFIGAFAPIGICEALNLPIWVTFLLCATSLCLLCTFFSVGIDTETKKEEFIEEARKSGFEQEEEKLRTHNAREEEKATIWRREHPLEESIRKALESKNCNDIAALARLYAKYMIGD